jgi:hypothetical protein
MGRDCMFLMSWSLPVLAAALITQVNPVMIPASNGTTCPGGTSYAGAGYCKVRGNTQYFPARNGTTCPGGSSYAGAGYCKVRG